MLKMMLKIDAGKMKKVTELIDPGVTRGSIFGGAGGLGGG